jgi:hypothetical protein
LLLGRFDRHKRIVLRVTASLIASASAASVLSRLTNGLTLGWRDQPHFVSQRCNLTRPVMRAAASLKADQTRRLLLEKAQYLGAAQLSVEDRRILGVGTVDLKNLLGQIQPDSGNVLHGTAPSLWR